MLPNTGGTRTTPVVDNTKYSPTAGVVVSKSPTDQVIASHSPIAASKEDTSTKTTPENPVSLLLMQFLAKNLTDDGALTMIGSPQNRAYLQLQNTNPDLDPSNPMDQVEITQKYILNTLFYSTTMAGEMWMLQDSWTTKEPVCGPSSSWLGIDCDSSGVVTGLNLTTNSMNGTLPSELRGLTALSKYTCLCNMSTSCFGPCAHSHRVFKSIY